MLAGVPLFIAMSAFYVTVIILAFPKIRPAMTFGLVIAGQMIMSVVLDHTNTLVAQQHSFSLYRLLGIAMIIAGVVIIWKFQTKRCSSTNLHR